MDAQTFFDRGVAEAVVKEELMLLLEESPRPLRIKFGVDPSSPDLTLGHVVCFRKLRQLQHLGHRVIVVVGDWTARIGDPSGRSKTRRMLDEIGEATVVATGGLAEAFAGHTDLIQHVEPDLTLHGLRILWQLNRGEAG